MNRINIKPMSVNGAWMGKRFKTKEYKTYEKSVMLLLPKSILIPAGKIKLIIIFGLSSKNADLDNPIKLFQDILQKCYLFNDRMIYEIYAKKIDVKKGDEFIDFELIDIDNIL
jgi:Holliday junction resolvase RusA-like endonuclease